MSRHEHQLVQSIVYKGEELDLSFLSEASFIETTSLDSPKLIFEYDDKEKYLRDDLNIREKDTFKILLSDPVNRDALSWEANWVIMTMPTCEGGCITFNLILESLHKLKRPASSAQFFVGEPINKVLKALVPDLKLDVGVFPIKLDFHLLPGQRRTRLIRQMAKELGAIVFIQRGTLVFRTLKELQERKPKHFYHYNDTRQKFQIAQYSLPSDSSVIEELTHRRFISWDDTKGVIYSRKYTSLPVEYAGVANKIVLDNLGKIPVPIIDAYMFGDGAISCGDVMDVTWNRSDLERPIDESLPRFFVIGLVSHTFKGNKYYCRIKGILDKH
ncbi:hypothetical protein GOP97_14970 [Vibrio cholerae]|uniref:hypothetical protein n=1 Tax=Vibrio cholerae TaxID=666 RepID=UPI002DBA5EF6|nr:hypothetical protein [Vibrio cholerae]MEB5557068.1 hypothetical protein [Vibrio cholerae]